MKTQKKLCPNCKSKNISPKIQISAAYGAPQMWKCNECGFESYGYLELENENKNKSVRKKQYETSNI